MKSMRSLCSLFSLFLIFSKLSAQEFPSRISVKESEFVTETGNIIIFRGMSSSDPDKLDREGIWTKGYFDEIKN